MEPQNIESPAADVITETQAEKDEALQPPKATYAHPRRRMLAVVGAVFTLLAWVLMMIFDWIALGCDIIGLVFSAIGCAIAPGPRRNLAITATIAASVLLLVFILIWGTLIIFL